MNKLTLTIITIGLLFSGGSSLAAKDSTSPGVTVVIDPGHGGHDPGAKRGVIQEKDINLKVAKHLSKKLTEAGLKSVILTRDTDDYVNLADRSKTANGANNAILVSLHINAASNRAVSGTQIYHFDDASLPLARAAEAEIKNLQSSFRGITKTSLTLLKKCHCPAILIEGGFISNPGDFKAISAEEFPAKYAEAVARGILTYRKTQK